MTRFQITLAVTGIWLLAAVAVAGAQAEKAAKHTGPKAVFRSASELKWTDAPDAKGVQQAITWGSEKGAHGAFAKIPGGTSVPLHTHSANSRTVVVSGTIVETIEGQKAKELGPGSYFLVPAEVKHITQCKEGADCVIYTDWSGAFDVKPVAQ